MLATVLKGERAKQVTFTIIETFFKVRSLKRELLALHQETDKSKQQSKIQHFGEVLSDIVMPDLQHRRRSQVWKSISSSVKSSTL